MNATARNRSAARAELDRIRVEQEIRRRRREREQSAPPHWSPLPGPQTLAYETTADITGYGGSAGSGKSDLLLGTSTTRHRASIIFRRVFPNLRGLIQRSHDMLGGLGRFNANDNLWRLDDGRVLEFGAMQYEPDKRKYQGRPHDYIGFDELTEFLESQFRFVIAWLRTTIPGQRCRVVCTFNPPTSPEGNWVKSFFAPWVDRKHHDPAGPGEVRWYATVDGEDVPVGSGDPFEHGGETIYPLSRTFIPARLADNPHQDTPAYRAVLNSLPEPLRSQLLKGDFDADAEADPWQVIPTAWVQMAQDRWAARPGPDVTMTAMGMDVAHGGKDKTVLARRYGPYFAELLAYPGRETPSGSTAAALAVRAYEPGAHINVDVIGYGASAHERLAEEPPAGHGLPARPINFAARSDHKDRSGKYRMVNVRAEAFWRLREALDPEGGEEMALPPDPELLADLCAGRYEITTTGIKIEAKPEIAGRIGRSPDKGDAVALAMLPSRVVSFAPLEF